MAILFFLVLIVLRLRLEQKSLPSSFAWDTERQSIHKNSTNNSAASHDQLRSNTISDTHVAASSFTYERTTSPTNSVDFHQAIRKYFETLDNHNNNNDDEEEKIQWIQDYLYWHADMRRTYPDTQLLDHPQAPKVAIMYMDPAVHQGGLTDRMKGIGHLLKHCHEEERVLFLKWYDAPLSLEAFLMPHLFNWTLPSPHPNVTTPERLRAAFEKSNNTTEDDSVRRVRLYRFTNQLGNYLHPYGTIWNAYFQPSTAVQQTFDEALATLGFVPGKYDAIHLRLGHPAYRNKKSYNAQVDRDTGYNFKGINRVRAISTAIHAIACSKWSVNESFADTKNAFPVYFYSDSSDLVKTVVAPSSMKPGTEEQETALSKLSNTTGHSNIFGRSTGPVAHLENRNNETSLEAYANTFVDLYLAIHARCLTIGVGRFAYMAAKISGTTCWTRHQTPSREVSSQWGMTRMIQEVPECPILNERIGG